MIRQYNAQRFRYETLGGIRRQVGTITVGTIAFIEGCKVRVEAWLPRDYAAYQNGRFTTKRIAGGHLAIVRRLRDNKEMTISDIYLRDPDD